MPPLDAQAPIEIAHLGCGICCQMRRSTGASLKGTRPAQISTSACRGEKLMRSMPKRARSYLLAALAMNSIAQHAVPNGMGHREFARDQLTRKSRRVVIHGSSEPPMILVIGCELLNPIARLPSSTRRCIRRAESG